MTEPGNGYRAIAVALALGGGGGSVATYTVAADYHKHIADLRVKAAENECRFGLLWEKMQEGR